MSAEMAAGRSFEVTKAEHGGWVLKLFEDGEEVGGGGAPDTVDDWSFLYSTGCEFVGDAS